MKDGLFKRYFRIFLTTLISCTLFLGLAMLVFSGMNYTTQRQELLKTAAVRAAEAVPQYWNGSTYSYVGVRGVLQSVASDYGVEAYLANSDGQIIQCSEAVCHHGNRAPSKAVKKINRSGEYESGGYFQGFAGKDADYLTGVPVWDGEECTGYLFTTTSIAPLFTYLYETMFTYLFSVGVMLLVAFVVIYTATMQLTAPLHEMSQAAESFGKGDFDARVEASGDDEIAILARSFNEMAESLGEFERNRQSFVANVSHDLRTPMTTIGGYIDGILDGTIPPEEQEKYLKIVSDEIKRLARLTSSLLSVMRLEERKSDVELVSVDAGDTIINILLNMEHRITEKKIFIPDLELPENMYVKANKDMLHQVIYNLMDNAVKYTPDGGEMRIEASADSARTAISIYNTGKGISLEEQSSIFERFYKTDKSRSIDRSGAGLGLYIVKMLTKGMGGDVTVDSDGESYTRFTVVLDTAPVPKDLIPVRRPAPEEQEPVEKKTIWNLGGLIRTPRNRTDRKN